MPHRSAGQRHVASARRSHLAVIGLHRVLDGVRRRLVGCVQGADDGASPVEAVPDGAQHSAIVVLWVTDIVW